MGAGGSRAAGLRRHHLPPGRVRELAELIGADALSGTDRRYLRYGELVERTLLDQRRDQDRGIDETLGRAWRSLAALPRQELTMLSPALLDRYLPAPEAPAEAPAEEEP